MSAEIKSNADTGTARELEDLDLLDDEVRHGKCRYCQKHAVNQLGVPFIALCGKRAVNLYLVKDPFIPPSNACKDCVEVRACPQCGGRIRRART